MNRLQFFKTFFQGAAVATIAPKRELSDGLKITEDFKKESKIDKALYYSDGTFYLNGNNLVYKLKRSEHKFNLRRE
jgi:hypothetical protein